MERPEYYHIPKVVAECCEPHEAFVYAIVYWFKAMKDGRCFASNERIAQALPYKSSASSVANAINKLVSIGAVTCTYKDVSKRHRKEIIPLAVYPDTLTGVSQIHPQVNLDSPTGEQNNNNYIEKLLSEIHSRDDYEIVPDVEEKPQKVAKFDPDPVFRLFKPKYPANWKTNKTQRQAAENLLTERGLEQIKRALDFYRESKELPFCPDISTPWDLDTKWTKLISFKTKTYGA